jgi:hypothetical protein
VDARTATAPIWQWIVRSWKSKDAKNSSPVSQSPINWHSIGSNTPRAVLPSSLTLSSLTHPQVRLRPETGPNLIRAGGHGAVPLDRADHPAVSPAPEQPPHRADCTRRSSCKRGDWKSRPSRIPPRRDSNARQSSATTPGLIRGDPGEDERARGGGAQRGQGARDRGGECGAQGAHARPGAPTGPSRRGVADAAATAPSPALSSRPPPTNKICCRLALPLNGTRSPRNGAAVAPIAASSELAAHRCLHLGFLNIDLSMKMLTQPGSPLPRQVHQESRDMPSFTATPGAEHAVTSTRLTSTTSILRHVKQRLRRETHHAECVDFWAPKCASGIHRVLQSTLMRHGARSCSHPRLIDRLRPRISLDSSISYTPSTQQSPKSGSSIESSTVQNSLAFRAKTGGDPTPGNIYRRVGGPIPYGHFGIGKSASGVKRWRGPGSMGLDGQAPSLNRSWILIMSDTPCVGE